MRFIRFVRGQKATISVGLVSSRHLRNNYFGVESESRVWAALPEGRWNGESEIPEDRRAKIEEAGDAGKGKN